jgi:hypothetical protein
VKCAAVLVLVLVGVLSTISAAAAQPSTIRSLADPTRTHIQLVTAQPVTLGNPTTLLGILHDTSTNQGIPGMTLGFSILTTFGWLPLGNQTTDDTGKAAMDYTPASPATYTVRVVFNGNATYAASNATATFTILPAAPARSAGLPPDTIIALIILVVVGGVWSTYGFVAWQVAGIRADRPEESEEETRRAVTKEKKSMENEEESEAPKRVPGATTGASRTVLILAVVALVLGGLALAAVGVQTLTKTSAYNPSTVNLQIAVVPDMQGSGWDVWLPNELIVHQGDTVKLTIFNADTMPHGFLLSTFNVDQALQPATTDAGGNVTPSRVTVTFTPDQVGSFLFRCNIPCGAGHDYMIGTFVVLTD